VGTSLSLFLCFAQSLHPFTTKESGIRQLCTSEDFLSNKTGRGQKYYCFLPCLPLHLLLLYHLFLQWFRCLSFVFHRLHFVWTFRLFSHSSLISLSPPPHFSTCASSSFIILSSFCSSLFTLSAHILILLSLLFVFSFFCLFFYFQLMIHYHGRNGTGSINRLLHLPRLVRGDRWRFVFCLS
jgi:hypothetical protein